MWNRACYGENFRAAVVGELDMAGLGDAELFAGLHQDGEWLEGLSLG